MSSSHEDIHPQTVPLLYDTLVKLGFNGAAQSFIQDSKKSKEELVKELNPKYSLLELVNNFFNEKTSGKKT